MDVQELTMLKEIIDSATGDAKAVLILWIAKGLVSQLIAWGSGITMFCLGLRLARWLIKSNGNTMKVLRELDLDMYDNKDGQISDAVERIREWKKRDENDPRCHTSEGWTRGPRLNER